MARRGTDEAGWSRGRIEKLRFMVVGGDDALMDKACGTILGERENRNTFKFGEFKPREVIFNSLKYELKFFESLLFPGPHAFLLVHRDVKTTGRENYLLQALIDVFGEKVLDYCMVLFIDKARHNDPNQNYCLMMCGGRYYILQNTDESVHQLFNKTKTTTQWKSSSFFINHFDYFKKAENYFKAECEEKKKNLSRELEEINESAENLKKEINDMKELNAKKVLELNERIEDDRKKLFESKDRENQLHNDLDAHKSRENQMMEDFQKLNEELIIYKNRANELSDDLDALKSSKNQTNEDFQKLKEELIIYKDRENLLLRELDALKSSENQMEDFQKLKGELIIYNERETLKR